MKDEKIKRPSTVVVDNDICKRYLDTRLYSNEDGRIYRRDDDSGILHEVSYVKRPTSVGFYHGVSCDGVAFWSHIVTCHCWNGPAPTHKHEVNHKDGNKINNRASNLEWSTRGENLDHAYRTGLRTDHMPVECRHSETDEVLNFYSIGQFGKYFDLTESQALNAVKNPCPFKGVWVLTVDRSRYDKTKASGRQFWVRDGITGMVTSYRHVENFAKSSGVKIGAIENTLRYSKSGEVAGYSLNYDKELLREIPEAQSQRLAYFNRKEMRAPESGFLVRRYYPDELHVFTSREQASKKLGLGKQFFGNLLNRSSDGNLLPVKGYAAKRQSNHQPFLEFDEEVLPLLPRIKKNEAPLCYVHDNKTDTTTLFINLREFAETVVDPNDRAMVVATAVAAANARRGKRPYKGRWTFEEKPLKSFIKSKLHV